MIAREYKAALGRDVRAAADSKGKINSAQNFNNKVGNPVDQLVPRNSRSPYWINRLARARDLASE